MPAPRTVVALLTVCLLVGTLGVVAGAVTQGETSEIRAVDNATSYLSPTNATADGHVQTDIDVGSAITRDSQVLHARQDVLKFEERFENVNDSTQRRDVVESTVREVEANVEQLGQRQAELFESYSDGELDEATLVRELVELRALAEGQKRLIEHTEETATSAPDVPLPSEIQETINAIESAPVLQPGPVEAQLTAAVSEVEPRTTYIQGSEDGLVLATVTDGTQYRQATILGEKVGDGTDVFAASENGWFDAATQRAEELYPWAWENFEGGGGDILSGLPYYFVEVSHPHGVLELYFDGTTENVFREHQENAAASIPITAENSTETDELALAIESTYPTGPMRITVTDPETALPVEATVSINDRAIGTVDGDGWTIQPDGEFTVEATTPDNGTAVVSGP